MNRSRSKGRLLETAFVSQSRSSTEDLDEVDRLANHPMLRPSPARETYTLGNRRGTQNRYWRPFRSSMRKSRSEMGGYGSDTCGGFSAALSQPMLDRSNAASCQSSTNMNQNESQSMTTYTPPAEFGCRTVAVGMMRGNGARVLRGNLSRMKRSTTINFQQFYSSQGTNNTELDNINSNRVENLNVSNSISSLSGFKDHNIEMHTPGTYNLRNSPSSSYWSNWTGDDENTDDKRIIETSTNDETGTNPASIAYASDNNVKEHFFKTDSSNNNKFESKVTSSDYHKSHPNNGEVFVTSAVVESQNTEHVSSDKSSGVNRSVRGINQPLDLRKKNNTDHPGMKGVQQIDVVLDCTETLPCSASIIKESHWDGKAYKLNDQNRQNSLKQHNISNDSIKRCEEKISSISMIKSEDNMTTTDTTGSCISSASNADLSSASIKDDGTNVLKVVRSPRGDNKGNEVVNMEPNIEPYSDCLKSQPSDANNPRRTLSNLISPPLPKFRLIPISLAHRRIKGTDKNKRLSTKISNNPPGTQSLTGTGSTPSNSSSADSTPQKDRQHQLRSILRLTNRASLSFDDNSSRPSSLDNDETGANFDQEGNIRSINASTSDSNENKLNSHLRTLNIPEPPQRILSPKISPSLSKDQLLKPPAPPRPKRAIVMKQLQLEKKNRDKKRSLFPSSVNDENDSDEDESCSFASSLESMKSYADSGGSTSDGIQSIVSSAESGVAALGLHSSGIGGGGSISSQNSSRTDMNVPQIARDRTPPKSQRFRIEQRTSGFGNSSSNIVSRQYVAKSSLIELRQHHNSMIRPLLASSKFPVLSPISDKSQEQCPSEVGDHNSTQQSNNTGSSSSHNRTPKVSPTEQILAACCVGGSRVEETDGVDDVTFVSFKQQPSSYLDSDNRTRNQNSGDDDCSLYARGNIGSQNNNVLQQHSENKDHETCEPAPFSMPKLERRLQQEQERRKQTFNIPSSNRSVALSNIYNNNNKGSDSGISMAGSSSHGGYSGESGNEQGQESAQDMFQLLQDLPFDMPKLRRKTQQIISSRAINKNIAIKNDLPTESVSSTASPFLTRILPPRPNSVPNNTTSSLLMQQGQFLVQNPSQAPISKEGNKNDEIPVAFGNARTEHRSQNESTNVIHLPQNVTSPPICSKISTRVNDNSNSGVTDKIILKTHNEIYEKFAQEAEQQLRTKRFGERENRNDEDSTHDRTQGLHFAKRLSWNLPVEDKMQTSTDGIETPTLDSNNTNLNLISQDSPSLSRDRGKFQGIEGSSHHGSAWDANQRSNGRYNSSNMNISLGTDKTNAEYSNDNNINSVQRTFQLNIPIRRTLPSQLNVPNNDNSNTSNMNISQISRKDHSFGNNAFELSSNRTSSYYNIAPPPPGFEDNEFYLTETQPIAQENYRNSVDIQQNFKQGQRRQRPKMTLSFAGLDSPVSNGSSAQVQRTLMFATNSPFPLNDCVEVNPNLSLERQDWYHGSISRNEAEDLLRNHQEGYYLIRNVDSSRQEYALCLKSAMGYMHMRIRKDPTERNFQLSDFNRRFITIPEMVHHYTRNRLPIKGAEHMCLKTPVPMQLL